MKILIKFPTLQRSNKFFPLLEKYEDLLSSPEEVFFVITLNRGDPEMDCDIAREKLDSHKNLIYKYGDHSTKIEACNADIDLCSDWDILLLASDDMIPQIKGYDDHIRQAMRENFPDTDGSLWFFDGFNRQINTLSILGKRYYDRFGYIYHPDYKSEYCDNEFTEVANLLGKHAKYNEVIIRHEHPFNTRVPIDSTYERNLSSSMRDSDPKVFEERKSKNFDLEI